MIFCPICASPNLYAKAERLYICNECGNEWDKPPEPLILTFPFQLGEHVYLRGQYGDVEEYEIVGYTVSKFGKLAKLKDPSGDGWLEEYARLDLLFATKEAAERSAEK